MALPPKPGAIINRDILVACRLKQADLARLTGLSPVRVHQLLTGKTRLGPDAALRLAKVTKTEPAYWLQLQSNYDLALAARKLDRFLQELVPITPSEGGKMVGH